MSSLPSLPLSNRRRRSLYVRCLSDWLNLARVSTRQGVVVIIRLGWKFCYLSPKPHFQKSFQPLYKTCQSLLGRSGPTRCRIESEQKYYLSRNFQATESCHWSYKWMKSTIRNYWFVAKWVVWTSEASKQISSSGWYFPRESFCSNGSEWLFSSLAQKFYSKTKSENRLILRTTSFRHS